MGQCPFCMAPVPASQSICYSCGRVVSGASGMQQRVRGEYDRRATYGGAKRGKSPTFSYSEVTGRRKRKGKLKNLVLLATVVAVFMFTPVQEQVLGQWAKLEDAIGTATSPYHTYPVKTSYTVERTIELWNGGSVESTFSYTMPIPQFRTSKGASSTTFVYTNQEPVQSASDLQILHNMTIQGSISVPLQKGYIRGEEEAISLTGSDTVVYYPGEGGGDKQCEFGPCVRWEGKIPPTKTVTLTVQYELTGTSYTWWQDGTVDSKVPGKRDGMGIRASNSGTFEDMKLRKGGTLWTQFGKNKQWFNRGNTDYAIDGIDSVVIAAANEVLASLPSDEQDNVYSFSRGAFDYVRAEVAYGRGQSIPRSGPACLRDTVGDCDEQSNAWMSILRVKEVPSWYEFGALTSNEFDSWEPHGWSNIMLPYSEDWCTQQSISLDSCYVEASVDVVNNKWLLHTPTAFSEWVEQPDISGGKIRGFYHALSMSGADSYDWQENWQTIGNPTTTGGTYKVRLVQ